jgi:hypothetical protein
LQFEPLGLPFVNADILLQVPPKAWMQPISGSAIINSLHLERTEAILHRICNAKGMDNENSE